MKTSSLFTVASEFRVRCPFMALMFGVIMGCGGSVKQNAAIPSGTIAFSSSAAVDGGSGSIGATNVWIGNADGTGATPITKLTIGGVEAADLVWSPDGSKLAFVSSRALDGGDALNANSTFNLWVVNADGSGATPLTRLTSTGGQGVSEVSWSPDGRRIVFSSNRALDGSDAVSASQSTNIWVVNSDGSGGTPLSHFTVAEAFTPVWSPDGGKIAFTSSGALDGSDASFGFNIWMMNADGSGAIPVTRLTLASNQHCAFSPDGAMIAFVSNRGLDGSDVSTGAGNIWIAKADGSGAIPLTKYTAFDVGSIFGGFWSPDGKKFAFDSTAALDGSDGLNTNSTENIWIANTDGSGATPMTHLAYSIPSSSIVGALPIGWSPDGASLAFTSDAALDGSNAPRFLNAWVISADGSNSRPLTSTGSISPAWKP